MSHEIHEPDQNEGQEFQTIIGQDPWLEEFARSPYDPINSARATGRLTGLAARHIYRKGWMRVAAFLIGLGMVTGSVGGVALVIISNQLIASTQLASFVFAIPFVAVGIKLMVHAIGK